jgi:putative transposase
LRPNLHRAAHDRTVFAGQNVGIKEVTDKVWLLRFMQYDLGFFDHETDRVTSAGNPFGARVLPMCRELDHVAFPVR